MGQSGKTRYEEGMAPLAVIEIGTSAVRMQIAQVVGDEVRRVDALQQSVSLGKESFSSRRSLSRAAIEQCVQTIRSFRRVLLEHGIEDERVRVVATTAVREAGNRDALVDRVYIATGFRVKILDEAEVTKFIYFRVRSELQANPAASRPQALVVEVGGGSTELLLISEQRVDKTASPNGAGKNGKGAQEADGRVAHREKVLGFARTYRLGSLRTRAMLSSYRSSMAQTRDVVDNQVRRVVEQMARDLEPYGKFNLVALGGDARWAAGRLIENYDEAKPQTIELRKLEKLTEEILDQPVDDLAQRLHLSTPEAEGLPVALLSLVHMARVFKLDKLYVAGATMRDGLLVEMSGAPVFTEEFREQVIRSAMAIGAKYHDDQAHSTHVAALCRTLFEALKDEHRLGPRHELVLRLAALLHEVGLFVSPRSHHKHSYYLIRNSEIFGLSAEDLLMTATVARYHRRSPPRPTHEGYRLMDREGRLAVAKLAAILRVADALDRSHAQQVKDIVVRKEPGRLVIEIPLDDLTLEELAVRQKAGMFEEVFGMSVSLRKRAE